MPAGWGKIRVREIISPIDGTLISGDRETVLSGISTDSRTTRHGDLFWALRGERYDGHDFVSKAIEQGAAAVVAQNDWLSLETAVKDGNFDTLSSRNTVFISVDDTLKALGDLAAWWRRRYDLKVVAITGSSGKTTTKEMAAAILKIGSTTLKNQGNFNNLIGLPLTLLKLEEDYKRAVLEMGMNRPGEISRLTEIADPDVGVILNVGMAHIEGLSDLDGVAKAKTELIEKISAEGLMILNGDDERLMKRASIFQKRKMTFGLGQRNDVRAADIKNDGAQGIRFNLKYGDSCWPTKIKVPGIHNLQNALAAAAIGLSLNEPPENIREGLGLFSGVKGRFQVASIADGIILVDDTYNSNPTSLSAALDGVVSLLSRGGRLIVGLGEMMELGDTAIDAHREAGKKVAEAGARSFFAMGEHAQDMINSAQTAGVPADRLKVMGSHDEMVKEIADIMREGDLIFLKGSRKMGLEKVVEGLGYFHGAMEHSADLQGGHCVPGTGQMRIY
jgi:UDP-N-acetylmuramoyl-tripeptide--D-alanyl-D-alanine ligase